MASISSLTAAMSAAVQAAKGTPATAGFVTGRHTMSEIAPPEFDVIEVVDEHGGTIATRVTSKKSADERTSYIGRFSGEGILHPDFIGMLLVGLGFGVSTTGTTSKTHTFTLADADAMKWLTLLHKVGTGAAEFERSLSDARTRLLELRLTPRESRYTFEGSGLVLDAAAGTEDTDAEVSDVLKPTLGSRSFTIGGTEITTDLIREATHRFELTLDEEDFALWQAGRADLPPDALRITGSLNGIDISEASYQKLVNGGIGNDTPSLTTVTGALDIRHDSSTFVTGTTPYSLRIQIPKVQYTMTPFRASGRDKVRFGIDYEMIDDSSTPITVTIVNNFAGYAAA